MQSARHLGKEMGITDAEVMNALLVKRGIIEGEPGNYNLTDAGRKVGREEYVVTGRGGYNKITYNDSVKELLVGCERELKEAEKEVEERRLQRREQRNNVIGEMETMDELECREAQKEQFVYKRDIVIALAVIGVIAVGTAIYKVTPKVKRWWNDKRYIQNLPEDDREKESREEN